MVDLLGTKKGTVSGRGGEGRTRCKRGKKPKTKEFRQELERLAHGQWKDHA